MGPITALFYTVLYEGTVELLRYAYVCLCVCGGGTTGDIAGKKMTLSLTINSLCVYFLPRVVHILGKIRKTSLKGEKG